MTYKKRYKGEFNWHGETHVMWTHAYSMNQARGIMTLRLARKLGLSSRWVRNFFLTGDNYRIEEVRDEQRK